MASLTWKSVLAWRVRRQHVAERAHDPLAVVSGIAGVHAQVLSSAELTLWARLDEPAPGWVDRALWEERSLVKTWAMPGRCTCCGRTSWRATSARSCACCRRSTTTSLPRRATPAQC